jgi:hypothetical protein
MPAGWLATKLGYKFGIIAGLLIVALGGFWFIPATHINDAGACRTRIAQPRVRGLSGRRLRHRHRPHVSGNHRQSLYHRAGRSALRGDAHQPGAILQRHRLDFGPIIGSLFFYSKDALGRSTGSQTLYIPYVGNRRGRHRPGRGLLLSPRFPTSRPRTTTIWTIPGAGGFAFHLVAPALRAGRGGAVSLRRRAGRHFQLLHQLHGGRSSPPFRLLGGGA